MAEHRDELIRDLTMVVSATVSDQIQDFAAQLTEHSRAAGKLAEGLQQLPAMAKQASEQFCSEKLGAFYRKFQEQLGGHSVRLRAVENRLGGHDSELQTLREQIQELRAALAIANVQPKPPLASAAGFDRDTDATIIRIMASKLVDLSAAQQTMSDWIVSCGIKAEFCTISSSEQVAKQFTIQFSGAVGPAARRVSQDLGARRLAPGQWKRFGVMAMGKQMATLHIGADKNPVKASWRSRAAGSGSIRAPASVGQSRVSSALHVNGLPPLSIAPLNFATKNPSTLFSNDVASIVVPDVITAIAVNWVCEPPHAAVQWDPSAAELAALRLEAQGVDAALQTFVLAPGVIFDAGSQAHSGLTELRDQREVQTLALVMDLINAQELQRFKARPKPETPRPARAAAESAEAAEKQQQSRKFPRTEGCGRAVLGALLLTGVLGALLKLASALGVLLMLTSAGVLPKLASAGVLPKLMLIRAGVLLLRLSTVLAPEVRDGPPTEPSQQKPVQSISEAETAALSAARLPSRARGMCFPPFCQPAKHFLGCLGLRQGAAVVLILDALYGLSLVVLHGMLLGQVQEPVGPAHAPADVDVRRLGIGVQAWADQGGLGLLHLPAGTPATAADIPDRRLTGEVGRPDYEQGGLPGGGEVGDAGGGRGEDGAGGGRATQTTSWMLQLDFGWGHRLLDFSDHLNLMGGLLYGVAVMAACGLMLYSVFGDRPPGCQTDRGSLEVLDVRLSEKYTERVWA
ncbi:unnamed protein product [Prorocentrum cordatum]|uniref:Uncharacterized protein n=1 Tax=Prorocentrum cordatum TaxID=2364126 RepID=A0ABN9SA61_9DINO|nr:unnamed protein product [Polarella glacialis]